MHCYAWDILSHYLTIPQKRNRPGQNLPPGNHGTFEKRPTKPPPGLTARLSSPPTHRPASAGGGKKPGGRFTPLVVIHPEAPNDHPTKAGSPITAESQTPTRWRPPGQATQAPSDGPNRTVLGHPTELRTGNTSIRQNRQEMSDPPHIWDTRPDIHTVASTELYLTGSFHPVTSPDPGPASNHTTARTSTSRNESSSFAPEHSDITSGHHQPPPFHDPALPAGPNPSSYPSLGHAPPPHLPARPRRPGLIIQSSVPNTHSSICRPGHPAGRA